MRCVQRVIQGVQFCFQGGCRVSCSDQGCPMQKYFFQKLVLSFKLRKIERLVDSQIGRHFTSQIYSSSLVIYIQVYGYFSLHFLVSHPQRFEANAVFLYSIFCLKTLWITNKKRNGEISINLIIRTECNKQMPSLKTQQPSSLVAQ